MNEQPRYYVMNTAEMGRAVFAARDLKIGEVVMYCEVLVLNSADTFLVNLTGLKDYTFVYNRGQYEHEKQDCLVLGDGEIFNHDSEEPSVSYELININGRPMMCFRMIENVKAHHQLFIDYNADLPDSEKHSDVLASYTNNLL